MTFAQIIGNSTSGIIGLMNFVVVPLIFALAFAAFIWGVVNYFFIHVDNETKRTEGRNFIIWGLVGMAVLLSVWGFVYLVLGTVGITPGVY